MNTPAVCFLFFMLFFSSKIIAQTQQDSIYKILVTQTFLESHYVNVATKKFISLKGKPIITKINPLTYLAGASLFVYQRVISEQISAECCYSISCSSYTKFSIEKFGLIKGALLGIHQFNNCFGGVTYDYSPYKVNAQFKILNATDFNIE
jgi:putative component of membrane protein insertase Oxa1/YidC/SpoIIIJ protein YidD